MPSGPTSDASPGRFRRTRAIAARTIFWRSRPGGSTLQRDHAPRCRAKNALYHVTPMRMEADRESKALVTASSGALAARADRAGRESGNAGEIIFLKCFALFSPNQCEGLCIDPAAFPFHEATNPAADAAGRMFGRALLASKRCSLQPTPPSRPAVTTPRASVRRKRSDSARKKERRGKRDAGLLRPASCCGFSRQDVDLLFLEVAPVVWIVHVGLGD